MPKGGARVRSGPASDPNSGRSDRARRAAKKTAATRPTTTTATDAAATDADDDEAGVVNPLALPTKGRPGNPPAYPLPKIVRYVLDDEPADQPGKRGKTAKVASSGAGEAFRKRELAIWRELWKTPVALMWEREPWRWPRIALYCRFTAVIEAEPDSNAALVSRQREIANEQGVTPDGMKANGWAIAPPGADELAAKRARKTTAAKKATAPVTRRLRG